jgi:hypothetical protein
MISFPAEYLGLATLAIAGWRIRLECSLPAVDDAITARYRAFLAPDGASNDAVVSISLVPDVPDGEWPARPVSRQGDICLFDVPGACGRIDLRSWQVILRLQRRNSADLLEQFLKSVLAYVAFHQGGLLFHSAGVLVEGKALLFTGEGGSGKSTVVALSADKTALNDDLVVLRTEGRGWRAYGTPFWNLQTDRRGGQAAGGPLAGIYRLVQDQRDYLEPIPKGIAISELMANCPVINVDPLALPSLMSRCDALAEAIRVQRLHFRRAPDFWACLSAGKDVITD